MYQLAEMGTVYQIEFETSFSQRRIFFIVYSKSYPWKFLVLLSRTSRTFGFGTVGGNFSNKRISGSKKTNNLIAIIVIRCFLYFFINFFFKLLDP